MIIRQWGCCPRVTMKTAIPAAFYYDVLYTTLHLLLLLWLSLILSDSEKIGSAIVAASLGFYVILLSMNVLQGTGGQQEVENGSAACGFYELRERIILDRITRGESKISTKNIMGARWFVSYSNIVVIIVVVPRRPIKMLSPRTRRTTEICSEHNTRYSLIVYPNRKYYRTGPEKKNERHRYLFVYFFFLF